MPIDESETRKAARERLAKRMEQRGDVAAPPRSRFPLTANRSTTRFSERTASASQRPASSQLSTGSSRSANPQRTVNPQRTAQAAVVHEKRPYFATAAIPRSPILLIGAALALIVLLALVFSGLSRCSTAGQTSAEPSAAQDLSSRSTVATSNTSATQNSETSNAENTQSNDADSDSSSNANNEANDVDSHDNSTEDDAHSNSQVSSNTSAAEMRTALVELIGEDEAAKLLETAKTDTQALWIAAHPDEYAFDGLEVQVKILKLAADEPQAVSYVREFPSQYPLATEISDPLIGMNAHSLSSEVPDTNIPHYYQWDRRWGNTVYSSAAFALTGCGPTSMAMVYQGLTGKTDHNPYTMGQLADERGFMSEYNGTANTFFAHVASDVGMDYEELYPTASNLVDTLSSGHVVIAHLGPGIFTTRGHYFVLAGLGPDNSIILNDPYSAVRSSQLWSADTIAAEATVFYSFSISA